MDYRIEQLRYLLREDPSSRIFYQLGELLRREGEAGQAVEVLRSGLERHPKYVAAHVSLGRSQRDLGALDEAKHAFKTALEIDRENPVAARLLGETAVEREDWLGAVKAFKLSRALTGTDGGLDEQIVMVEARLDEDNRLKESVEEPPRTERPARNLEIVNLSVEDPFSASSDEAEGGGANGDVFEIAEVSAEVVAEKVSEDPGAPFEDEAADVAEEESQAVEDDTPEEPAAAEPLAVEDALEADAFVSEPEVVEDAGDETPVAEVEAVEGTEEIEESDAEAVDGHEAVADVVSDADADVDSDAATATATATDTDSDSDTDTDTDADSDTDTDTDTGWDESSVGAWSATMKAVGVSGEKAWTEPTDEPAMSEGEFFTDDPWAAPTATPELVELPAEGSVEPVEPVEPVEADEEVVEEEGSREEDLRVVSAEIDPPPFSEGDESLIKDEDGDPDITVEDEVLPGEDRGLESIEVTRPIELADQVIAAEAKTEEEARAEVEIEQEEAAVEAEPVEIAPTVAGEGPSDAETVSDTAMATDTAKATDAATDTDTDTATATDAATDTATDGERRHDLSHGVPLPTMTLAKLALQQDDRPLAMATLESLIERDPTNTEAHAMLDELSAQDETVANEKVRAERATTKIAALQGWLDAVRLAAERRVQ